MPLFIYSWNFGSEGADLLKQAMKIKKIKHEKSLFKGDPRKTVLNWGSSDLPREVLKSRVINPADRVTVTSNKLSFFRHITDTNRDLLPPWTTDQDTAIKWVTEGHTVCARTVLNGHSANGLVLMHRDKPETLVRAPLYTRYIKKDEEYRVHIVEGTVIDTQRKVLKKDFATKAEEEGRAINWKIRNLDNGFIYQRNDINPDPSVHRVALEAIRISGLNFGAVDVIFSKAARRSYVLEINSAPGITGTTVENYARAFERYR